MTSFRFNVVGFGGVVAAVLALAFPSHAQVSGLYKDGQLVEEIAIRNALNLGDSPAHQSRANPGAATGAGNQVADRSRLAMEALQRLAASLDDGSPVTAQERASLEAAADEFRDSHDALLGYLRDVEQSLAGRALSPEILERQRQQTGVVEQGIARTRGLLDAALGGDSAGITALDSYLATLQTRPMAEGDSERRTIQHRVEAPRLSAQEAATVRQLIPQPEEPQPSPTRRGPRDGGRTPELAETPEIEFTPEITAKAAELGNDPLAIFEFVRNEIEFQPYLGSRKGAAFTLEQLAGNDVDQASLLLALLRCSGIPSRYARGTGELSAARAMGWLGVDDPATAASILATAGLDGVAINAPGGGVVSVQFTLVWVEAKLPINNYRGVGTDETGMAWLPMVPAFKQHDVKQGVDVFGSLTFDEDEFYLDFVSELTAELPFDRFASLLTAAQPETPLAAIERSKTITPVHLGLLPASLPFRSLDTPASFNELQADQRYRVRLDLRNGATSLIDWTTNLSAIAGKRVMVDYVPATAADAQTIDSYGGIYGTPPSLVNLRPRVMVDGEVVAESVAAVGMGRTHHFGMEFFQPAGASNVQPSISNTIIAGDSQAIAFDTFLDRAESFIQLPGAAPGGVFDSFLHETAENYLHRVDLGFVRAERLMQLVSTHDVSEAIVGNQIKVALSFGTPVSFDWEGLFVDADRRVVGPFSVEGDNSRHRPFMLVTGMEGSNLENRVFEDGFEQDAVSTVKILQLASEAGIPVCTISTSIAADCPGFSHPVEVRNAVTAALAQGHVVTIPRDPITTGLWSGTGYSNLEPNGAGGWIISGGINGTLSSSSGGATSEVWPFSSPCDETVQVLGDVLVPPHDAPHPMAVFCADDTRLQFTSVLVFICKEGDPITMTKALPFNYTTKQHGGGNYEIRLEAFGVSNVIRRFTIVELLKLKVADAAKPTHFKETPGDTKIVVSADPLTDKATVKLDATVAPALPANGALVLWKVQGDSATPATGDFASSPTIEFDTSSGNRDFVVKAGCDDNKNGVLDAGEVGATMMVQVSCVDLDIDADHNGSITDADDDPVELAKGGIVGANVDDDDFTETPDSEEAPVAGEDDLEPIQLGFTSMTPPTSGTLTLEASSGGSLIRLWESATKSGEVALPKTWEVGTDTIPGVLYVEGLSGSMAARDVKLKLTFDDGGTPCEDEIALTVVEIEMESIRDPANIVKFDASKGQETEFVGLLSKLRVTVKPASSMNQFRWTIGGTRIKTYEHDIDEADRHKRIDLETADLEKDEVSFFWRDEGNFHSVKVAVTIPGAGKTCDLEVNFKVFHRSDPNHEIYCNAATSPLAVFPAEWVNPNGELNRFGGWEDTYDVLKSHRNWHEGAEMTNEETPVGSAPENLWGEPRDTKGYQGEIGTGYNGSAFLDWHKGFLDAHSAWRMTFDLGEPGSPPSVAPDKPEYLKRFPAPVPPPLPDENDLGKSHLYGYVRLGEFQDLDQLGRDTTSPWHGSGHNLLTDAGGPLMASLSSPAALDDTFWKWHGLVDTVREGWMLAMTDQAAVQTTIPADGTTVEAVNGVMINFDLPVSCSKELTPEQEGLNQIELRPGLLRVNGSPATTVDLNYSGSGPKSYKSYIFSGFTQPAPGPVTIELTGTPSFESKTWTVTRSP